MKPSIGRIVRFFDTTRTESYPAIITKVWTEDCVNLVVFGHLTGPAIEFTSITNIEGSERHWAWPVIQG